MISRLLITAGNFCLKNINILNIKAKREFSDFFHFCILKTKIVVNRSK
jgi:hypothetical protein